MLSSAFGKHLLTRVCVCAFAAHGVSFGVKYECHRCVTQFLSSYFPNRIRDIVEKNAAY